MNKVTWSTRKALVRDTIVVIVGILLMTLFLFVVDVTWNFLLSRDLKWLGVGGGRSTGILPTFEERQEYSTQKRTGDKAEW
jgi:preprotein translocase SecE subunit